MRKYLSIIFSVALLLFSGLAGMNALQAQTLPLLNYSHAFDGGFGGWSSSTFNYNGFDVNSCIYGDGNVHLQQGNCSCSDDGVMISPLIGTTGGGAVTVSYTYQAVNITYPTLGAPTIGYLSIAWSTSAAGPWTIFQSVDSTTHSPTAACIGKSGTFTPPAGPVYLRFTAHRLRNGSNPYRLKLHNVTATEALAAACSGTPAGGTTTANYAQSCVNVPMTYAVVPYVNNSGYLFQWQSSANGTNWTDIAGATSHNFTATESATIWYRRKITCTAGNLFAYSTALQQVATTNPTACLCTSGPVYTTETDITNVTLGTLNNSSACYSLNGSQGTATGSGSKYSNWTASTVPVPLLPQGTTQPFTLNLTYCGSGFSQFRTKMYIDFNGDADFDDPGEQVYETPFGGFTNYQVSSNISIPASATLGPKVMRVINGDEYGPFGTCGNYANGETEDYLVNIVAGPGCAGTPANAVVTGPATVCPTSAFSLNASNFAQNGITGFAYQWQSSPSGTNTWTDIAGATAAPSYANVLNPVSSATIPLGQLAVTDYRLKVTCTNSNQFSYSNVLGVGMSAASACYCASAIVNAGACQRWISNVTTTGIFTNINNTSACTAGGYANYTAAPQPAQHHGYPVSLSLTSAGGPTWWNIYVDYDNNGSFSAGELVYQNNNTAGALTVNGSFTIPASVAIGTKRMRIQADDNTTANPGIACASLTGETEDYNLVVMVQPACTGTPTAGTISMSGSNTFCGTAASRTFTATSYTNNLTGVTLIWQVSPDSLANFVDLAATGPVLNSPANTYNDNRYYRLKVTCTNTNLSAYSNVIPLYTSYASVSISPGVGTSASLVCQGSSVQLLASGVGTFVWNADATLSCTACANPVASPNVQTTYYVTATNSVGCTSSDSRLIFLGHRPIVNTVTASTLTPCQGQFVNLSGSAYLPATYPGFAGPFAPQHWTLTQSNSNGTLDVSASADSVVFVSSDSTGISPLPGTDTWSIPMTYAGSVTFNWQYSTAENAASDYPQYSITGTTWQLLPGFNLNGPAVQSGTATIPVVPGTIFRLRNNSTTNTGGSDTVVITAFVSPGGYSPSSMRWFTVPTGGSTISMNVIPAGPNPISYYGEAYTGNGCASLVRKPVTVTPGLVRRWTGATSTNWILSSNWCGGIPTATTDVVIPGAHTVTYMPQMSGSATARNIRLDSNATVTVSNLGTLSVYGDITGPGAINATAGTVNFAGNIAQAVAPGFTVKTLSVNGGSTKTLSENVQVTTALNLTDGILDMGSDTLTLAPAAVISGGSALSYIRTSAPGGRLKRTVGATPVLFPVGNSTYNPVTLANAGTADVFTVGVRDAVLTHGIAGSQVSSTDFHMVNRTWNVDEQVAGGSNVTMTAQWTAGQQNTSSFDYGHVFVSHYTGGQWSSDPDYPAPLSAPAAGGYPGAGPYTATRNDITTFSPFSLASALGIGSAPLPVTLVNLQARNNGSRNRISWASASETAMKSYQVERSDDGIHFSAIAEIAALNKASDYESYDYNPAAGFTYYRLRMKDGNGSFRLSGTVKAYLGAAGEMVISAQPNPVNDVVTVRIDGATDGDVSLLDLTGRSILSVAVKDGQVQIDMRQLTAGAYFLRYANSVLSKSIKISKR